MTIGTKNNDFCLISGVRCVAIGLYVMLEDHESCRVLFLRLIFLHSKCYLLCIKVFSIATFCLGHGIFSSRGLQDGFMAEKNRVFLRIFFFWEPICYKISKIPKISIYVYLTISMSSSTMCRSRNSQKLVVGVAGFEILEL